MGLRLSRPTLGNKFCEGSRLLWLHVLSQNISQKELSEALGLGGGGSQVSHWLYGRRKPGLELALLIEERLGIPAKAWTEAPSEPFELPTAPTPSSVSLPDDDDAKPRGDAA